MVLSGFRTVKNVEYSEPTLFVGFCIGVLHIHGSTFVTTLRYCDVGPSLINCCATIGTEWIEEATSACHSPIMQYGTYFECNCHRF